MRKILLTIIICLISAMLIAGCKEASDAIQTEQPENVTEDVKEEEDIDEDVAKPEKEDDADQDEDIVVATDYEAMYAPVFEEVLEAINDGYDFDKEYKYTGNGLSEKIMYPGEGDLHDTVGYLMKDMNEDGIPELLIGSDEKYDDIPPRSVIYNLFTIKDDEIVSVFEGWARSCYQMMGDDHFYYVGSGGAAITLFGEDHLSKYGCDLVWDDFYFSDEKEGGEIGLYHNDTGIFDANVSEEMNMSEDEFFAKMDDYEARCVMIPWTPVGNYKSGNSNASDDKTEEPSGTEISIDAATQKKMNIFLSNFSEAGLFEYDQDHRDLSEILHWVDVWCKINNNSSVKYGPRPGDNSDYTYEIISLEDINKVTDKYFGFTLTDEEASQMQVSADMANVYSYENGHLYVLAADGEARTYFSVVSKAEDLGNDRLKLSYCIYSQDLDAYFEGKDIDYSLTDKEASDDPEYEPVEKGYAIVRIDKDSYKLEHLE